MARRIITQNNSSQMVGVMPCPQGLWGGKGGGAFDDEGSHYRVAGITLTMGACINTITITYQEQDGSFKTYPTRGTNKGSNTVDVPIGKDENIVGITGYYGTYADNLVVTSLTFHTDKKNKYGPYGAQIGKSFECLPIGSKITGFYGFSGHLLDCMGCYFDLSMQTCDPADASKMISTLTSSIRDVHRTLKGYDWKPLPAMSWGGQGTGNPWDDGTFQGIREIQISYDDKVIHTIETKYVGKDGDTVQGVKHGYVDGQKLTVITLNYPQEFLVSVSGTFGKLPGFYIQVKSLKFISNFKEYGPYGDTSGEAFSSPESGCKIAGVWGRSGWLLDNFGVHLVTNQPLSPEDADAGWNEFIPAKILANVLNFNS